LGLALLWPGIPTARAEATDGDAGAYAGAAACIDCHEDAANALHGTPHGQAGFELKSSQGCETCHGPAKAHADSPRDKTLFPLIKAWPPERQSDMCRSCHDGGQQFHWPGSVHERFNVTCTDCHSVHSAAPDTAQLQTQTEMETCFGCHPGVRAESQKTSHHPVREEKIGCADCHNPHGTSNDKLLREATVNEQCWRCHAEKRGPFLWEHAPVRESCLNCHVPHGSNHAKLLASAVPYQCQQCHANTRHPGSLYDATTLPGAVRQSNRLFDRGCLNCHAAIHGSNHPSGPYLGR
jgi:DmsE family decaheme c-type cytochrome